jgi:histidinol-phosphate aminotransferase
MPPFPVNLAALVAAKAAVDDRAAIKGYLQRVNELRDWLGSKLQALGVEVFPSAGNFLLANFGPKGPTLFRQLERTGILLRDRSRDLGPGFVRITIGTKSEMILLVQKIKKAWRFRPTTKLRKLLSPRSKQFDPPEA